MIITTFETICLTIIALIGIAGILEDNHLLHIPTPWDARQRTAKRRKPLPDKGSTNRRQKPAPADTSAAAPAASAAA